MKAITVGSKVTPCGTPSPKTNNFISERKNIAWMIRYYIWVEAMIGINRTYLFKNMKFVSIISFFISLILVTSSMLLLLFTSGLASTMLVKFIIKLAQSDESDTMEMRIMIAYACIRCLKYTILIIFPCYLASATTNKVNEIREMLYEAINSFDSDKIERRKVKAFYQMTRDSEFSYVVSGIIKLDMSLPLSYCSLCTTYLVIVIQFSKFFD
ncbi:uncharacterized protein [Epargyreus clarus]|uniref:uncharacterized protein n=1 Tax=Epargyreus clarus TaxID=520877 RepID=UPI003C2EAFB9